MKVNASLIDITMCRSINTVGERCFVHTHTYQQYDDDSLYAEHQFRFFFLASYFLFRGHDVDVNGWLVAQRLKQLPRTQNQSENRKTMI